MRQTLPCQIKTFSKYFKMCDMKEMSRTHTLSNKSTNLVLNVPEYIILSFQMNYFKVLLVKSPFKNLNSSRFSIYGILLFAIQLLFSQLN